MQRLLALILLASLILLSACKEDTASSKQATNIPADQIAATYPTFTNTLPFECKY